MQEVRIIAGKGLPQHAKFKMLWFLRILACYGRGGYEHMDSAGCWLQAFCNDEEETGLDTDTFNIAVAFGWVCVTHNTDTDVGNVFISDNGQKVLRTNAKGHLYVDC